MHPNPTPPPPRPAVSWDPSLTERIRGMRAAGRSLQSICDELNAEGVPTVRGAAQWRPSALQTALGFHRRNKPSGRRPKQFAGWWVYRLYGSRGHLLYIGVTGDVSRRLREHSEKVWWVNVRRTRLRSYPTRLAAEVAERLAIEAEQPILNKVGKGGLLSVPDPISLHALFAKSAAN